MLDGGAGNDVLTGGAGDDIYRVSAGNDVVHAGDGFDELYIGPEFHFVSALDSGDGNLVFTYRDDIGNLSTTTVIGHTSGSPLASVRFLSNGQEVSYALAIGTAPTTDGLMVAGTDSPDLLDGGAGNDFVLGNGGGDTLLGGDDADILVGGGGQRRDRRWQRRHRFRYGVLLQFADRRGGEPGHRPGRRRFRRQRLPGRDRKHPRGRDSTTC